MADLRPSEEARRALGIRLRELRLDAGLSGVGLAARCGWTKFKVSKIEHAGQAPSEADIRAWCAACGAEGQIPELVAFSRQIEQMWADLREVLRIGQKTIQKRGLSTYGNAKVARVYESLHVPGILQTFGYACRQFTLHADLYELPTGDIEEAARNRLSAQILLGRGGTSFSFLLEATVLHNNIGGLTVMDEQFDFLTQVATLPNVALGVIPLGVPRTLYPGEAFYLFDDHTVRQEFWSGAFKSSRPSDIAHFARAFAKLRTHAVYGDRVRREIEAARARLVQLGAT
ncbi:helix-turn-helix transcriptional regulator [Actinocorallia sp. A-T 12471]|uniref:helix-turn-helix domain-containing protein n=1 Tax=Actinocorallia sp. A-T 12471 TaxID=3089813 RepID=UPI0029CD8EF2|nr:helix-turn-helix transcriptional regulator [Actinocorallia sp. A-T 12471]MDX6740352.1 helix-turn-helix transcriptional regulator [Actinocorallia sp. A-T 12471]